MAAAPYDAVVLDLGLPKVSGLDVLGEWRRQGVDTPVLILFLDDRRDGEGDARGVVRALRVARILSMAGAPDGLDGVAADARHDVEMQVRDGLSGSGAVIDADIEAVGLEAEIEFSLRLRKQIDHAGAQVRAADLAEKIQNAGQNDQFPMLLFQCLDEF